MVKNKKLSTEEFEEVFDFSDMDINDSYEDTNMSEIMHLLMESNNQQMKVAVELTKIIVENNLLKNANENDVFSLFKKASKVVNESYNLDNLMDQLGQK